MHIDTCTYMHVRSREQEEKKKALKFDEIHKIGHFFFFRRSQVHLPRCIDALRAKHISSFIARRRDLR